jgi:hypothetical protein
VLVLTADSGRRRFLRQTAVALGGLSFLDTFALSAGQSAINPADDPLSAAQGYLEAAPRGIDARWAWTQPNGAGEGVAFVDVERGWFIGFNAASTQQHEDLPGPGPRNRLRVSPGVPRRIRTANCSPSRHHGSAVVGVVAASDNSVGSIGIAPRIGSVELSSYFISESRSNVVGAIDKVLPFMGPGDILLIEQQADLAAPRFNLPAEVIPATFNAIARAIARGVIVIEPAGNFHVDLDSIDTLNPSNPMFRDSGAIIVGACNMPDALGNGRTRWVGKASDFPPASAYPPFLAICSSGPPPMLPGSNFGPRVDCYAWGEGIVSAGYGWIGGTTATNSYTNKFGGTSGAAAIVAGAAVVIQGMHKHAMGRPLTPSEMRTALRANGTPQQPAGATEKIGVMPDVRKAANALGI